MRNSSASSLSSYTLLTMIACLVWIFSFFVPSGTYIYRNEQTGAFYPKHKSPPLEDITAQHLVPVLKSYHTLPKKKLSFEDLLEFPFLGAYKVIDFLIFILALGVFLEILKSLHLFEKLCTVLIHWNFPPPLLLILFLFLLSLLISLTGLRDENVVFFSLLVPLLSKRGIGVIPTSFMILFAVAIGIASSVLNPTIVGIFATLSQKNILQGGGARFFLWITGIAVASFLLWKISPKEYSSLPESKPFSSHNFLRVFSSTLLLITALGTLIWDLSSEKSLLKTDSHLLFLSLLAGFLGGLKENEIIVSLKTGMQNLLPITINISIAQGILYLLEKSEIRDTILLLCFRILGGPIPLWVFSLSFLIVVVLGFFLVNSTSAMASISFSLLYPMFVQMHISYSTFIFWFLIAAGFSQLFNPTGFLLNHICKESGISYRKWCRFSFPIGVFFLIAWIFSIF